MSRPLFAFTSALTATTLWMVAPVSAQSVGDLESAVTRGAQFEDARTLARQQEQQVRTDGGELDGEAGVYVLDTNEIFTLRAVGGIGFSTNPTRTLDVGTEDSFYGSMALSAGANTVINESVNAGLNLVASATEYQESTGPNFRNLLLSGYLGKSIFDDFMFVSLGFNVGSNFNGSFGDSTGFYGLTLSASKAVSLRNNLLAQFNAAIGRSWSDNADQTNTTITPSVELIWVPAQRWQLSGAVSYVHRRFKDFFEDVTLTKRKDNAFAVEVAARYTISPRLVANAGVSYTKQDSSFFLSEFEEFNTAVTLGVSHRF